MKSEKNLTIASCLLLAFAILLVYWQTKDHSFISFDDYSYFAMNERVQSGLNIDNIIWAFKTSSMSNWHPVTWLSYMLDTTLHGGLPSGIIFINILLHTASAILLFLLLLKTTGAFKESLIVALLFALHPTRVESVAWVSERKDVLSVFFMFLTISAYIKYTKAGSLKAYLAGLFFFALGLMSKPMLVSLPLILILLDHWPLNRFKDISGIPKLLTEKIPFILLAMLSSFITLFVQLKDTKALTLQALSLTEKIANSLNAYMAYLKSFLIPVNLVVLYPFPESISLLKGGVSLLILLLISALVIRERRTYPYLVVGWGIFVVALIPVIGIVQVGLQFIADRYTYMPFIGLFIIAAFGTSNAFKKLGIDTKKYISLWAVVILILTGLSYKQVSYWKDNITLYSKTVAVTKGNYLIHNKLGHALLKNGQTERAIDQFTLSVRARPDFFAATLNLATTLKGKGYHERAIKYYLSALKLRPTSDIALMGTCQSLLALGKTDEALDLYSRTTGNSTKSFEAMIYMGNA
jgi:tetratricopeptide (TPR) repeat protein